MLSSAYFSLLLRPIDDLMVLTNSWLLIYHSSVSRKTILNHSGPIGQGDSRVGCLDDGLRILARLIAHDLVTKRQDSTNNKTGRKVGAHKYWGVAHEDLY